MRKILCNIKKGDTMRNIHLNHYKFNIQKGLLLFTVILCFIAYGFIQKDFTSSAAEGQVGVQINYLEEVANITPGSGLSTKYYMSTDGKKTWEYIDTYGIVDISALLKAKETTIYFKGNKDITPLSVTLLPEDKSFQASYKIIGGEGKISFSGATLPVEYRKGANGQWKAATDLMPTALYEMKGATLYFRTTATAMKRAGSMVTIKIAKRATAPSVKLDGSKLYITGFLSGVTQYRVGDSSAWIMFITTDPKIKSMDLKSLLGASLPINTPIPAGVIEVRTIATEKKVASAVKVIEVPLQQSVPDTIQLNGTTITITDTDTSKKYEYAKIDKTTIFDMKTAKWTAIPTSKVVVVKKTFVGDKILVRLKSATDATSKMVIPASTYKEFIVATITLG